jgi:hypothetical protein
MVKNEGEWILVSIDEIERVANSGKDEDFYKLFEKMMLNIPIFID